MLLLTQFVASASVFTVLNLGEFRSWESAVAPGTVQGDAEKAIIKRPQKTFFFQKTQFFFKNLTFFHYPHQIPPLLPARSFLQISITTLPIIIRTPPATRTNINTFSGINQIPVLVNVSWPRYTLKLVLLSQTFVTE